MTNIDPELERECRVLTRYLIGEEPTNYAMAKYEQAHRTMPGLSDGGRFDQLVMGMVRRLPVLTRSADAYSRFFARRSDLRKKLVMLLAILESCGSSCHHFDLPHPAGRTITLARVSGQSLIALLSLLAGLALFSPVQIASRLFD